MNIDLNKPRYGWQCPICDKVHAPFVAACDCHERPAREAFAKVLDDIQGGTESVTAEDTARMLRERGITLTSLP